MPFSTKTTLRPLESGHDGHTIHLRALFGVVDIIFAAVGYGPKRATAVDSKGPLALLPKGRQKALFHHLMAVKAANYEAHLRQNHLLPVRLVA